jgi:hypothetical protein
VRELIAAGSMYGRHGAATSDNAALRSTHCGTRQEKRTFQRPRHVGKRGTFMTTGTGAPDMSLLVDSVDWWLLTALHRQPC